MVETQVEHHAENVLKTLDLWRLPRCHRWGWFYLASCVVMACGVINPHRKSLVMAGLICMATAWIFRVEKKQMKVLGVTGAIGLSFLLLTGNVPDVMKRSLSTIIPHLTIEAGTQGHMGWEDDFRSRNLDLALNDITHHPFVGRGFSFSTAEVVDMLARKKTGGATTSSELAGAVGLHHYGYFSLMTHIGAIVPFFYAVAMFGIFIRFMKRARAMPDDWPKVLAAGMSCYFITQLFQWLFNGAGDRMLDLSIALGVMMGLMQKWQSSQKTEMINDELLVEEGATISRENGRDKMIAGKGRPVNGWARSRK